MCYLGWKSQKVDSVREAWTAPVIRKRLSLCLSSEWMRLANRTRASHFAAATKPQCARWVTWKEHESQPPALWWEAFTARQGELERRPGFGFRPHGARLWAFGTISLQSSVMSNALRWRNFHMMLSCWVSCVCVCVCDEGGCLFSWSWFFLFFVLFVFVFSKDTLLKGVIPLPQGMSNIQTFKTQICVLTL